MAGIAFFPGWAAHPTPRVLDRWDRLDPPRLGDWTELQPSNLKGLPRYPSAKQPYDIKLNTVYWPTHLGGYAFGWFLTTTSQLKSAFPGWPAVGGYDSRGLAFYTEVVVGGSYQ